MTDAQRIQALEAKVAALEAMFFQLNCAVASMPRPAFQPFPVYPPVTTASTYRAPEWDGA